MNQASIQSFYSREVRGPTSPSLPHRTHDGMPNGFTDAEIQTHLHPTCLRRWHPAQEYRLSSIADLHPGNTRIQIQGRVVNLRHQSSPGARQPKPNGYWRFVLKDDTGAINIRLWYAKVKFDLRLGQLVSVWAIHVAVHDPTVLVSANHYQFITIFPEVDTSCHVEILQGDGYATLCRRPLEMNAEGRLLGLMTLRDFINGGNELAGSKILLAIKSIGQRKRITAHKGTDSERQTDKQAIRVFDDTAETTLTLWDTYCSSSQSWVPSSTILLLTDAAYKEANYPSPGSSSSLGASTGSGSINLVPRTLIEVDPALPDANWLRAHVQGMLKRGHVNPPYSEGIFDLHEIRNAEERVLFRLQEMDGFVRARPHEAHVGWFSMVLFELGLVRLHSKGQLCCNECCNIPLFANAVTGTCKQCDSEVELRPNPRLITTLLDSTGALSGSKLIVHPGAWPQLLGLAPAQLVAEPLNRLRQREARMLYMRVTLLMGWAANEGRLVLLGVES